MGGARDLGGIDAGAKQTERGRETHNNTDVGGETQSDSSPYTLYDYKYRAIQWAAPVTWAAGEAHGPPVRHMGR